MVKDAEELPRLTESWEVPSFSSMTPPDIEKVESLTLATAPLADSLCAMRTLPEISSVEPSVTRNAEPEPATL